MTNEFTVEKSKINFIKGKCHMYFEEIGEGLFNATKNRGGARGFFVGVNQIVELMNQDKTIAVQFLSGNVVYNRKFPFHESSIETIFQTHVEHVQ